MAVTVTETHRSNVDVIAEVTATADADTTATIPHPFGRVPEHVEVTYLGDPAIVAAAHWGVTSITDTQVVIEKATGAGSGGPNPSAQVHIELGQGLIR